MEGERQILGETGDLSQLNLPEVKHQAKRNAYFCDTFFGGGNLPLTLNVRLLLCIALTVTTTGPLIAPLGIVVVMEVLLQAKTAAVVPLKVTLLVPWVFPNPSPKTVTIVPVGPRFGDREEIVTVDGVAHVLDAELKLRETS